MKYYFFAENCHEKDDLKFEGLEAWGRRGGGGGEWRGEVGCEAGRDEMVVVTR